MRRTYNQLRSAVDDLRTKGVDIDLENNGRMVKFTNHNQSKDLSSLMLTGEAHEWLNGFTKNAIRMQLIKERLSGIAREDLTPAERQITDIFNGLYD